MTDTISYGSFCTGYDGIGLGLKLAGLALEPRWMAEVEPAMGRVLKREHDGVPNVGDLKAAPWSLAPRVKLVSSGDPCQSISIAGRQAGRDDPRFLWPWVRAAYRELRPAFLFFENVANIVSHDGGRTLAERFAHLREDGYAVRWTVLGACAVGAPHHRHRWYALAAHVGPSAPEAVRVGGGRAICGAPRSGGRLLLPSPMARDGDGRGEGDPEYWARRLETQGRTNGRPLGAEVLLLPSGQWGKYAEAIALWESITGVPAPEPTEASTRGGLRLSPLLPEWMMGLRPGLLTDELTRPEALKGAGNGCVPQAVAAAYRLLSA